MIYSKFEDFKGKILRHKAYKDDYYLMLKTTRLNNNEGLITYMNNKGIVSRDIYCRLENIVENWLEAYDIL